MPTPALSAQAGIDVHELRLIIDTMDMLLDSFIVYKGYWANTLSILSEHISLVAGLPKESSRLCYLQAYILSYWMVMLHMAHVVLPMVHTCS